MTYMSHVFRFKEPVSCSCFCIDISLILGFLRNSIASKKQPSY